MARGQIVLTGKNAQKFLARKKYNEAMFKIYLDNKLGQTIEDPYGVMSVSREEWEENYINSLPPLDINMNEEYW